MIYHDLISNNIVIFDFEYSFEDGIFTISEGSYSVRGNVLYSQDEPFVFEVEEGIEYNFVLTTEGFIVVTEWTDDEIPGFIDIMAWGNSEQMQAKRLV